MSIFRFFTLDGRKQSPQVLDFTVIPTLAFSYSNGKFWGWKLAIAIKWGYWAAGAFYGTYKIQKKEKK